MSSCAAIPFYRISAHDEDAWIVPVIFFGLVLFGEQICFANFLLVEVPLTVELTTDGAYFIFVVLFERILRN